MSSIGPKFYVLYQMIPNPLKIFETLFFSEPVIEKFSSIELKCFLVTYSLSIGHFVNKRVSEKMRRFLTAVHTGTLALIWTSCISYLTELETYDVGTITFGVIPMIIGSAKFLYASSAIYSAEAIEKFTEFFINEDLHSSSSANFSETVEGTISVKKWLIVVVTFFVGFHVIPNVFSDPESQLEINNFTKRPYLIKFFPMWCPFESSRERYLLWALQDIATVLDTMTYCFGTLTMFLPIITMHNKFTSLLGKLKLISEYTFQRIERLDKGMEETVELTDEQQTRSPNIEELDRTRIQTMELFHEEFVSCVIRFQQLQRAQLSLKKWLDFCFSITYCYVLSLMVGFGFYAAEAFSKSQLEFDLILKMGLWLAVCSGIWFMSCVIGDLFSRQTDVFADEVYSMPWYHFSPTQRKTVFTFLTIIQKPTYLRALKLFNLKMELFPDFLNTVYSYVQTMSTLQSVKHKNM